MVSFYRDAQSGSVLFGTSATPPIRQVLMNGGTQQYMPKTRINPRYVASNCYNPSILYTFIDIKINFVYLT